MLTNKELQVLYDLRDSLSFVRERELLCKLLFEYQQYSDCGTPEDCKQRKEWMELSLEDVRTNFNCIVKDLRDEVKIIKEEAAVNKDKKKRGRPRKK